MTQNNDEEEKTRAMLHARAQAICGVFGQPVMFVELIYTPGAEGSPYAVIFTLRPEVRLTEKESSDLCRRVTKKLSDKLQVNVYFEEFSHRLGKLEDLERREDGAT